MKFYNGIESTSGIVEGYSAFLKHVSSRVPEVEVSLPVLSSQHGVGDSVLVPGCPSMSGKPVAVRARLFHWVEGDTMYSAGSSPLLLLQMGRALGRVTACLVDFDHPSFHRKFAWDICSFTSVKPFVKYIPEDSMRALVDKTFVDFETRLNADSDAVFRQSVVFGDCNDANVIVRDGRVTGLIDVGDATYTWTVNDVAICMAYAVLSSWGQQHPRRALAAVLTGYVWAAPLKADECSRLLGLIRCRLATSIACGAYSISKVQVVCLVAVAGFLLPSVTHTTLHP